MPLGPEFQAFIDLFVEYESPTHKIARGFEIHAKSLVQSLQSSRKWSATLNAKETELQEILDLRTLQLLRGMLHNEIKLQSQNLTQRQNDMAELGAILPVASMLSVQDDDVVRESLALLVVMLENGNKSAQEKFLDHFLGTREETFFGDIQSRIQRSMESRTERRMLDRQLAIAAEESRQLKTTMRMGANQKKRTQAMLAGPIVQEPIFQESGVSRVSRESGWL